MPLIFILGIVAVGEFVPKLVWAQTHRKLPNPHFLVMNIFTYGSLMYNSVWSRVVSQTYQKKVGTVTGFQRLKVKGQRYPGLIKDSGTVEGVVYFDVSDLDVARLDHFEGELYQREKVDMIGEDGVRTQVFVYVIRDAFVDMLDGEWSKEEFEQNGLAEFEARYIGFDRI